MLNMIASDIFRVKKGSALRGVLAGVLGLIFLMCFIMKMVAFFDKQEMINEYGEVMGGKITIDVSQSEMADLQEFSDGIPRSGSEFVKMMLGDGQNGTAWFIIPFIIAVFGADFSSGAFRNLLTYESDRKKIYTAKFITTAIFAMIMMLFLIIVSGIIGGFVFGFQGFGGAFMKQVVATLCLQLPIILAFISLGHCILAFSKRCSYTIAIYMVGTIVWSMIVMLIGNLIPNMEWVMQLDLMSAFSVMVNYWKVESKDVIIPLVMAVSVIIVSFVAGMVRYEKTDFDFT